MPMNEFPNIWPSGVDEVPNDQYFQALQDLTNRTAYLKAFASTLTASGAASGDEISKLLIATRKEQSAKRLKGALAAALTNKQSNIRYYDPSLTTGANDGTSEANAWRTWSLVRTWAETTLAGNLSGYTLAVRCGTTTRGMALLNGVRGSIDSAPFQIIPYGDGDLPEFAGGQLVTNWTANGDGTYWYSVAADCDAFENGNRLLKKTIATGTEAATLLAAGVGTCGYNSSTGKIWIYPSSINSTLEINDQDYALQIIVQSSGSAGNIHIYGMHGRLARNGGIVMTGHTTTSGNTYSGCVISHFMAGNIGVDAVGGGSAVGDGVMLYGPYSNNDSVKATYCKIANGYIYDCLNNAVEIAATSGCVIECNESDGIGGNCIAELWSNNDGAHMRYNIGRGDPQRTLRLNGNYFSATAVWINAQLKSGSVDSAGTYSNNNKAYFNLVANPGLRGFRITGSQSGTKIEHNTIVYTDESMISGGTPVGAGYFSYVTSGITQTVTWNRNLVLGLSASLLSLVVVCDKDVVGTTEQVPSGDYNAYIGQSVGWRKGGYPASVNNGRTFDLATWRTSVGAGLDANSLAGLNSGGTTGSNQIGLDWVTFRPNPAGACAGKGTDALGYSRDYYGTPVSSVASAGFIGAVAP